MFSKHHTASYIFSRIKQLIYYKRYPHDPWMTKEAIYLLKRLITINDRGIEFGSGRSTRWFAERCKYLTSIENHEGWYRKVSAEVQDLGNVEYLFAEVDKDNPEQSKYLTVLSNIPESSLDFVVNDGKIRDWVGLLTIDKLKIGGVYILDNAERYLPNTFKLPESIGNEKAANENWDTFITHTSTWRRIWTIDGISSTLLLIKT